MKEKILESESIARRDLYIAPTLPYGTTSTSIVEVIGIKFLETEFGRYASLIVRYEDDSRLRIIITDSRLVQALYDRRNKGALPIYLRIFERPTMWVALI